MNHIIINEENTWDIEVPRHLSREEIEYGIKEFVQGLLVGFIIGFIVATQLL